MEEAKKCAKVANPGECSEEQIKKCHGDSEEHPCEESGCTGAPDPNQCSDEQKRKCHGPEGCCGS